MFSPPLSSVPFPILSCYLEPNGRLHAEEHFSCSLFLLPFGPCYYLRKFLHVPHMRDHSVSLPLLSKFTQPATSRSIHIATNCLTIFLSDSISLCMNRKFLYSVISSRALGLFLDFKCWEECCDQLRSAYIYIFGLCF